MAVVDTLTMVMPNPGSSVDHHHPRAMSLPGNSVVIPVPAMTMPLVEITETGTTMDLVAKVVPPLGLCRIRARAATMATDLKADTPLLVLQVPPVPLVLFQVLLPGSNRLHLVASLHMEDTAGMLLTLLAWALLVLLLLAWVPLHPLPAWLLQCTTMELLAVRRLRRLLVMRHPLLLRVTCLPHLLLRSDLIS
jgi:hypothetical protein